jgi:ethanolaminephosphotransferase
MKLWCLLVICICTEVLGLSVFFMGFFPFKSSIQGHASYDEFPSEPVANSTHSPLPFFNKLAFILVDALREDFADCSGVPNMKYLCEKVADGQARAFKAIAHSPTVTMPRIKVCALQSFTSQCTLCICSFNRHCFQAASLVLWMLY